MCPCTIERFFPFDLVRAHRSDLTCSIQRPPKPVTSIQCHSVAECTTTPCQASFKNMEGKKREHTRGLNADTKNIGTRFGRAPMERITPCSTRTSLKACYDDPGMVRRRAFSCGAGHRAVSALSSKAHVWHCRTRIQCGAEPCCVVWQRPNVVTPAFQVQ